MIQKATDHQQKLGPPPDPKDQLPEETANAKEDLDNKEMQDDLLNDKVSDKTVDTGERLTGDRMARSAQRLAGNDPGAITQEIQKRIIIDIDSLIKMAQQQQSQSKPGKGKPGDQPGPPKPGEGQGQQQVAQGKGKPQTGGQQAAQDSSLNQANNLDPDLNAKIKETLDEWGRLTQRNRQAVQEGANEEVIGKYQKLIEDYYRSLAEQASKK